MVCGTLVIQRGFCSLHFEVWESGSKPRLCVGGKLGLRDPCGELVANDSSGDVHIFFVGLNLFVSTELKKPICVCSKDSG